MRKPNLVSRPLFYLLLGLYMTFTFSPLIWLVSSSVQNPSDSTSSILPSHPTLEHYVGLLTSSKDPETQTATFLLATRNSITVAVGTTAIAIALGTPAAYAFARLRVPFGQVLLVLSLVLQLLPPIVLVVPLFLIMRSLGLLNTRLSLVAAYSVFSLPFVIWIMTSYFQNLPRELEDAARIDGCTRIKAMRLIAVPLAAPGLAAGAVFVFFAAWDEFLYALIFTSSYAAKTLLVALAEFVGRFRIDWSAMTAGAVIASMLPVAMALLLQRYITTGLPTGSMK